MNRIQIINIASPLIKKTKLFVQYIHSKNPPWNVMFYGTDEFSVASLKALSREYRTGNLLSNLEVVTACKTNKNPVEKYAEQEKLKIHNWPIDQKECSRFHVGVVVSFGHLIPRNIIEKFNLGMLNVHASLLPRWRGAAPIIYAIANGDKETGITIMKIKPNQFDIGEIVRQTKLSISPNDRLPDLLVKLSNLGSTELITSIRELPASVKCAVPQSQEGVTYAPKINSKKAIVPWQDLSVDSVINLDRALTGIYPLTTTFNDIAIKLYNISKNNTIHPFNIIKPGLIKYCKESKSLKIQCADGKWINVTHIGVLGRKMMSATDFNNGFLIKTPENLHVCR